MAQKVNILLVDDLDGSEASETVAFGLNGSTYEIDLSEKNLKAFHKAISPYVEKGRRLRGSKNRVRSGPEPRKVREWAAANGIEVNPQGRVPKEVVQQYEAAQGA